MIQVNITRNIHFNDDGISILHVTRPRDHHYLDCILFILILISFTSELNIIDRREIEINRICIAKEESYKQEMLHHLSYREPNNIEGCLAEADLPRRRLRLGLKK